MLIHITRGRLKHVRGEEIKFFKAGDAFIESNSGSAHYVKNVGKKPAYTSCRSFISSWNANGHK